MHEVEATVYPTIVVGKGEVSTFVLHKLVRLLRAHRSPALHVVAIGSVDGGSYTHLHLPEVHTDEQFHSPLAEWMHHVRTEHNLSTARREGVSIGTPGGYLLTQILFLVDSAHCDEVEQMFGDLREAAERSQELIPSRLHVLVIHPSYDLSSIDLRFFSNLKEDRWLSVVSLMIAGLTRSDGSTITREQLAETLPYLLFAALQPAAYGDDHWLFRPPSETTTEPFTLGFGLMMLPLPEIEQALSDKLVADTLSTLQQEPDEPPPLPEEIAPDEASWWRVLLSKLPGLVSAGAGLTLSPIRQEAPVVGKDPNRWLSEADEWDERWRQEDLPRWENALQDAANDLLAVFRLKLRDEVSRYFTIMRGALPLVSRLVHTASGALEKWTILKSEIPSASMEALQSARTHFEATLKKLPSTKRLVGLAAISIVISWSVLAGALYLLAPFIAPFLMYAAVAAAVLPPLIATLVSWWHYRSRWIELQEAWQQYVQQVQHYHAQLMRIASLNTLRRAAEQLQMTIQQEAAVAESLSQKTDSIVTMKQAVSLGFRMILPPWIRAAVTAWKHLEPVAQELWGHRDLPRLIHNYAEKEGLTSLEDWLKGLDRLATHFYQTLVNQWMSPRHRRIAYYLCQRFGSQEKAQEWLQQQMEELGSQADCLLCHCEHPALLGWQLVDPTFQISSTTQVPYGDNFVAIPDVVGRVCLGKARHVTV